MKKEVKYNIELFLIDDFGEGYKNFFYFLIRYFFNSSDFNGRITKKEYLEKGISYGFNINFLENVYKKGKYENNFINDIYKDGKDKVIKLKSIFNKDKESNLFVYIDINLLKQIRTISDFRSLSYIVYACRPYRVDNKIKKKEYIYKTPSRTINNIGYNFGKITKDVMWHRLEKAKKRFNDFVITKRITTYNEETTNNKYIVRIASLYSMKNIRYKRYSNKNIEKKEKNDERAINKKYSFIHHKNINTNKAIFGDTSKNSGFLDPDFYQHSWYKIKKQVFEKEN